MQPWGQVLQRALECDDARPAPGPRPPTGICASADSGLTRVGRGRMVPMRAEEVIATHGNTDFDAFAAMLAARRLYPSAVVAVGALNRNVRDFYRLHAEELGPVVEINRLELDAIKRLVVIEGSHAPRPGGARAPAEPARGHSVRARDPRGHGLAHLPLEHAAGRGRARVVPSPR